MGRIQLEKTTTGYPKMKKLRCIECYGIIEEYNEMEAYDEKGNDAHWDDSRKTWICVGCKYP